MMYYGLKYLPTRVSLLSLIYGCSKLFYSWSASARAGQDKSSMTCRIFFMVC
jgi:hypothetical protein